MEYNMALSVLDGSLDALIAAVARLLRRCLVSNQNDTKLTGPATLDPTSLRMSTTQLAHAIHFHARFPTALDSPHTGSSGLCQV